MNKFNIILADPPWTYRDKALSGKRGAGCKYDLMTQKELISLPINKIAADNSILFIWVTMPKLDEVFDIIKSWGFEYKTCAFTWIKRNRISSSWFFGMGRWTRCLGYNTKIYIYDISKKEVKIENIGDISNYNLNNLLIWTHFGWRKILDFIKIKNSNTNVLKTKFMNIEFSDNHKFLFKRQKSSQGKNWIHLEFADKKRYKYLNNLFIHKHFGYGLNLVFSKNPVFSPTEIDKYENFNLKYDLGWLIGLFVAEGSYDSNQIRFSLHKNEISFYEKIKFIIESLDLFGDRYFDLPIKICRYIDKYKKSQCVYFSSKMVKSLIENFCYGIGAHGKRLNINKLLQTPINFRNGIFDGIMHGDGHYFNKSQWKLSLCNKNLILDIRELCHSIGIQTSYQEQKPQYRNGTCCYAFIITCLKTKQLKNDKYKNIEAVTIEDFQENVKTSDLYDVCVDGGEFIANNIISHNSNAELCLLATKGKPKRISASISSIIDSPIENHSKKPDIIREKIIKLCGDLPRIELFARKKIIGWESLGYDIDGRDIRDSIKDFV